MSHRRVIILDSFSDDSVENVPGPSSSSPSFVSSSSHFCSQVVASAAKKRASEDEEEEDSIANSSESEEATTSAPSAAKKQKVADHDQEQNIKFLPHQSEQESRSLKGEAPTNGVSAAKELKVATREEEQEPDVGYYKSLRFKGISASRNEKQQKDSWSQPSEQVRSPFSEVATTIAVLDDEESNTPSRNEKQQKDSRSQASEHYLNSLSVLATTSAVVRPLLTEEQLKSNTPSRDEWQEEDSWSEPSEQVHSSTSEAAATSEVLAAVKSNTPSRDEEQEMSSKRRPKANRHFEGTDIEDDEDQQEPYSPLNSMSQTFPEVVHMMVTETAATQPDVINWVHNGTAFTVRDPKSNKLEDVLEKYFNHRKYSSLQRQLNMYGWQKHLKGKFEGAFYNEFFHRDRGSPADLAKIRRRPPPPRQKSSAAKRSPPSEELATVNGASDEDRNQPAMPTVKRSPPSEEMAVNGASDEDRNQLAKPTVRSAVKRSPPSEKLATVNGASDEDRNQLAKPTASSAAKRISPSEKLATVNGASDEDRNQLAKPTARRASSSRSKDTPSEDEVVSSRSSSRSSRSKDAPSEAEVVSTYVKLDVIPSTVPRLDRLTPSESNELELALQFDPNEPDDGWQNDWSGHVALFSREVTNPLSRSKPGKSGLRQPLWEWALTSSQNRRLAQNLLRHVYYANGTPPTARRILAHAYHQSMRDPSYELETAMKRVAYDPAVLREDGWTTAKKDSPIGATGGPYHIGLRIVWEKWEAVVIAYIHDSDIGDLWKALWFDGNDTFDLEAEELQLARRKWERKFKPSDQLKPQEQSSTRFAAAAKFTVEGIEHGIVMAKTYNPQARKGLFWPARIMHVSELDGTPAQSKRSSTKKTLQVIFLAPYWNFTIANTPKLALADSMSQGTSTFSSGPLFELDTLDASGETIQKYPYEGKSGLNLDQLRVAFRFTGLPRNAFSRFLDSHRLALALKTYAQEELKPVSTHSHAASAALTDTHPMAIETAKYPSALLHLPFEYILSHLPRTTDKDSLSLGKNEDHVEPTIQLQHIMLSMEPPACWGKESGSRASSITIATPINGQGLTKALSGALTTPVSKRSLHLEDSGKDRTTSLPIAKILDIASDYLISTLSKLSSATSLSSKLLDQLAYLLSRLRQDVAAAKTLSFSQRRKKLLLFLMACLRTKGQGEDTICSEEFPVGINAKTLLTEWRKACENVFKHASIQFSCSRFGNSVTFVISDSRCNEHITSNGCVERPVRLPAALKGARQAGASAEEKVEFLLSVGDEYMTLAEQKVIGQAHSSVYLKRMRLKCAAIEPGVRGVPLTDDSNNEGGEDTRGSRGSYTAAVAGVAAAIKGVDMILGGQCVNAFCATRPPGHHAGRELHPMKAISNGFCILNTVACAALYATTPLSEHGPGLKRVCVIDFDVHHGNGTQDILCQTYDPRFLYVSLHAGGAHINGYESEDSDPECRTSVGGSQRKEDGIFPGRCGDTSPHKGVLNIPLGARVTAQNVGNALVSLVGPAMFSFSPDLIIVSAGFDAHKNDPLGMGGLSAEDFGHITDAICSMAYKSCSGRVLSIMEGGYGVPCCRPQKDLFLPPPVCDSSDDEAVASGSQRELKLLDLGSDLPDTMDDQVPAGMQKKLDRCHAEGFVDCVREHVRSLAEFNDRSKS